MSNDNRISRYPVPEVKDLPEDIQGIVAGANEAMGFVPNVLSALTYHPGFLRSFMSFNEHMKREDSGLNSLEREMMIVVFSVHNGCDYCIASHGFVLAGETGNPELVKQLKEDYTKADITPRQKAVIEFGMKVTTDPHNMSDQDFETLRSHGMSDADIFDTLAYAAFYNMSNRMMSGMGVLPDEQFKLK